MTNPKGTYYTFRIVSGPGEKLKVECCKWEEFGDQPLGVYKVDPETKGGLFGCTCPAYRECKHLKCVKEALADGKAQEFHKWKWQERGGWQRVQDGLGEYPELE